MGLLLWVWRIFYIGLVVGGLLFLIIDRVGGVIPLIVNIIFILGFALFVFGIPWEKGTFLDRGW